MGTHACQYLNVSPSPLLTIFHPTSSTPKFLIPSRKLYSLVEMFVGIICACMPSAAQSVRHNLHHYESLKTRISYRLYSLRSRHRRTHPASSSDMEKNQGSTADIEGPYLDLRNYQLAKHSDLAQTKGVRTFIQGGTSRGDY